MPYGLQEFCAESRAALRAGPLEPALAKVAERLALLIRQPDFVAAVFSPDTPFGRRELFHDPELDFHVLAHVQAPAKRGAPHDHGESWAVYGTAMGVTKMTDWRRANDDPDHVALEAARSYDLDQGEAHFYGPRAVHSTEHPDKAWVIRVTGTDLDAIPRYRFRAKSDRILEGA